MLEFTTVLVFVIVLLLGYWMLRKKPNLPPGPGLRFIFRLLSGRSPRSHHFLLDLQKEYGNILSLSGALNGTTTVFVFDYEMIKKLFIQKAEHYSNRPNYMWLVNKMGNSKGIVFNPTTWKATRKFALHSMRDFGLGKQSLDERIKEEAAVLVNSFRGKAGRAFDPQDDISKTVSNIICSITFGKRYPHDDEEFAKVLHYLDAHFKTDFTLSPLNGMPFLRHFSFISKRLSIDYYMEAMLKIREFMNKEINEHRETYEPDNMRDLVDLYIQAEKTGFQDMKDMDEQQLFQMIMDLFLAGTETTTSSLRWILLYLINNQEVQEKCRQEIHMVIGRDPGRLPEYRDRVNFPYTMAMIHETLRLKPVALGSLPHVANVTTEIGGYTIPKESVVIGINAGIMYDPKIWGEDVEDFRPERWLNEDGVLKSVPEFIPFSIGRRACIGEQLAWNELFINTVALLQSLSFVPEYPDDPPKTEGETTITYSPFPFKLVPVELEK